MFVENDNRVINSNEIKAALDDEFLKNGRARWLSKLDRPASIEHDNASLEIQGLTCRCG